MSMLERTRELMKETPISVIHICNEIGVKRDWYYKVLDGSIDDPGVNKIEAIYNYLKRRQNAGKKKSI